jgi:hypothetical protein
MIYHLSVATRAILFVKGREETSRMYPQDATSLKINFELRAASIRRSCHFDRMLT